MTMPARCFQCKTRLGGKKKGKEHAQLTGHVWSPGYYCALCEATFSSHKLCKNHRNVCCPGGVPAPVAVAGNAPMLAEPQAPHERRTSISSIVSCRTCGEHFRDAVTLEKHREEHNATACPRGPSNKFKCTTCKLEFKSQLTLAQHAASVIPCKICKMCIPRTMMSLEDHYRVSTKHPMPCPWCNRGFHSFHELAPHYEGCMPSGVKFHHGPVDSDDRTPSKSTDSRDAEEHTAEAAPSYASSVVPEIPGIGNESIVKYAVSTLCTAFSDVSGVSLTTRPTSAAVPEPEACGTVMSIDPALQAPQIMPDIEPLTEIQDNARRPAVAVPGPEDDVVEYDGFTDDADRSSVIAKAALDLISQRYGGGAAERILRAMQELGGAIAEEENGREGSESLQHAAYAQEEPATPMKAGATDTCSSPSSAVLRFVDTQRAALATKQPKTILRREPQPHAERPQASTSAQIMERLRAQKTNTPPKQPPSGTQSWHCRSCANDPCVWPVATACGHIFCHDCLIRELQEHGACPVCQKVFLLRLDVGVPACSI